MNNHNRVSDLLAKPLATQHHLSRDDKILLLQNLWNLPPQDNVTAYDVYFSNYERRYHLLSDERIGQLTHGTLIDVFKVIVDITRTRGDCIRMLEPYMPQTKLWTASELAEECIDFIGQAVLLVDLSRWPDTQSLRSYLCNGLFPIPTTPPESIKLNRAFTMQTLSRVAGFDVEWTDNVDHHLSLTDDDTTVYLFHDLTALGLIEASPIDIFPPELFTETRKTLSLLIPTSNPAAKRWFTKQQNRYKLDQTVGSCEYLRLEDRDIGKFNFWRDRLLILREAYDEHEPEGLKQFWFDKRRSGQRWTFWIAFLVFIIAVIQFVEGAMQVYKAYHPSNT